MNNETEERPNPHMAWVVEHGAIGLPLGHPSRVTVLSIFHDEHEAASACYEAGREFNARMWPISLNVNGSPGYTDEIASRTSARASAATQAMPVSDADEFHAANQCVDAAVLYLTGSTEWPSDWLPLRDQFLGIMRSAYRPAAPVLPPVALPALTDSPKADHVHENWWLIESTFAPVPLYYAGHRRDGKAPHMIADANKAVRFPDHNSALYTICHLFGIPVGMGATLDHMGYAVREHIFDYTPLAASAAPAPEQMQPNAGAEQDHLAASGNSAVCGVNAATTVQALVDALESMRPLNLTQWQSRLSAIGAGRDLLAHMTAKESA